RVDRRARRSFGEEGAARVEQDGAQRRHAAALRAEWRGMPMPRPARVSNAPAVAAALAPAAAAALALILTNCSGAPPAPAPPGTRRGTGRADPFARPRTALPCRARGDRGVARRRAPVGRRARLEDPSPARARRGARRAGPRPRAPRLLAARPRP